MSEFKGPEAAAAQFEFRIEGSSLLLKCLTRFYDVERVRACAEAAGFDFEVDRADRLSLRGIAGDNLLRATSSFLSGIHGHPRYYDYDWSGFRNAQDLAVSRVILLTCNDLFSKNHLIPSIIRNSQRHAIEIIIISNGFGCEVTPLRIFPVIDSDFQYVARAYKRGVAQSRGKYIALFHDDCLLDDERWIDKTVEGLNGNVLAMTGEFAEHTAKCRRLVMKGEVFLELGGFDGSYSWGNEDGDLTYTIHSRGGKIHLNITALHFQVVSTIVVLSRNPEKFKNAAACNVLPLRVWREIKNFCLTDAMAKGVDVMMARDMLHFNSKFRHMLFGSEKQFSAEQARLAALLARNRHPPLLREDARAVPGLLETLRS